MEAGQRIETFNIRSSRMRLKNNIRYVSHENRRLEVSGCQFCNVDPCATPSLLLLQSIVTICNQNLRHYHHILSKFAKSVDDSYRPDSVSNIMTKNKSRVQYDQFIQNPNAGD